MVPLRRNARGEPCGPSLCVHRGGGLTCVSQNIPLNPESRTKTGPGLCGSVCGVVVWRRRGTTKRAFGSGFLYADSAEGDRAVPVTARPRASQTDGTARPLLLPPFETSEPFCGYFSENERQPHSVKSNRRPRQEVILKGDTRSQSL